MPENTIDSIDIAKATLAEIGRFVASRTGNTDAAKIAGSRTPQIRYDAVSAAMLRDPAQAQQFGAQERLALVARINNPQHKEKAIAALAEQTEAARVRESNPRAPMTIMDLLMSDEHEARVSVFNNCWITYSHTTHEWVTITRGRFTQEVYRGLSDVLAVAAALEHSCD